MSSLIERCCYFVCISRNRAATLTFSGSNWAGNQGAYISFTEQKVLLSIFYFCLFSFQSCFWSFKFGRHLLLLVQKSCPCYFYWILTKKYLSCLQANVWTELTLCSFTLYPSQSHCFGPVPWSIPWLQPWSILGIPGVHDSLCNTTKLFFGSVFSKNNMNNFWVKSSKCLPNLKGRKNKIENYPLIMIILFEHVWGGARQWDIHEAWFRTFQSGLSHTDAISKTSDCG